jgi:uncharacterized protein YjbI with pentapeptide repeats
MGFRSSRIVVAAALFFAACSSSPATEASPSPAADPSIVVATTVAERVTVVPAIGAAPHLVDPGSWCMRSASFGQPADSPYVLPYRPGERHVVSQSYCNSQGTHQNQMAYDFDLPMGTDVLASRSGVVIDLNERTPDGPGGTANYVVIRHDDGTYALYGHLRYRGVDVEAGQRVESGERIGASGASGDRTVAPHLHFAVGTAVPTAERANIAVNFSNAQGDLDALGGLLEGVAYLALEPTTPIEYVDRPPIGDYSGAELDGLTLPGAVLWAFGFTGASMRGADLSVAEMGWAALTGADLTGADLSGANLQHADLEGAVLREASLAGANLTNALLRSADLRDAVLRNAYLAVTDLSGADLSGADLDGASLIGSVWDEDTRWPEGYAPPPRP